MAGLSRAERIKMNQLLWFDTMLKLKDELKEEYRNYHEMLTSDEKNEYVSTVHTKLREGVENKKTKIFSIDSLKRYLQDFTNVENIKGDTIDFFLAYLKKKNEEYQMSLAERTVDLSFLNAKAGIDFVPRTREAYMKRLYEIVRYELARCSEGSNDETLRIDISGIHKSRIRHVLKDFVSGLENAVIRVILVRPGSFEAKARNRLENKSIDVVSNNICTSLESWHAFGQDLQSSGTVEFTLMTSTLSASHSIARVGDTMIVAPYLVGNGYGSYMYELTKSASPFAFDKHVEYFDRIDEFSEYVKTDIEEVIRSFRDSKDRGNHNS